MTDLDRVARDIDVLSRAALTPAPEGNRLSNIERWTIQTHDHDDRLAIVVRGAMPAPLEQTRLVLWSEYEALTEQLAGAVSALEHVRNALLGPHGADAVDLEVVERGLGIHPAGGQ